MLIVILSTTKPFTVHLKPWRQSNPGCWIGPKSGAITPSGNCTNQWRTRQPSNHTFYYHSIAFFFLFDVNWSPALRPFNNVWTQEPGPTNLVYNLAQHCKKLNHSAAGITRCLFIKHSLSTPYYQVSSSRFSLFWHVNCGWITTRT